MRVPYARLESVLVEASERLGIDAERAHICARLFAEATLDGVHTHGIRRFPRLARQVAAGAVVARARPERVEAMGAMERWNSHRGVGNVHAHMAMQRAIELAETTGVGCVALSNATHWIRGGSYGWQAAEAGCIGLCWSNTMPNVPPWGGADCRLGNNPLVLAVPRVTGHVVLDTAVSQFSYGALDHYARAGQPLPVPGGFDEEGRLSTDAARVRSSGRVLPIGFWKGSGLSLLLDLIAASLSGGNATYRISTDPIFETDLSQLFIAFDMKRLSGAGDVARTVEEAIGFMKGAVPSGSDATIRYPGERALQERRENLERGVPVDADVWREVVALAEGSISPGAA